MTRRLMDVELPGRGATRAAVVLQVPQVIDSD
jgi:hypothetical protein